jgi:short subunit dehydrogenase-like uncharacterized protein
MTQIDIIVYGATGFTGAEIAKCIAKVPFSKTMHWCLAGRDEKRLLALKSTLDLSNCTEPEIAIADVKDPSSLLMLFKRAKVVVNCVGPFRFFGPPVVEACAKAGTSYVDITGEPEFVLKSVTLYTEEAKNNGACIVHCCGFDSVPADMGVVELKLAFAAKGGVCQSVEMVHTFDYTDEYGSTGNYATYESAIEGFANAKELVTWRKELDKTLVPLPKGEKLKLKGNMSWDYRFKRYLFVFPGADSAVVRLSQRQLLASKSKVGQIPPVQFAAYVGLQTLVWTVLLMIVGFVFSTLAKYEMGRSLLKKYPALFSLGGFTKQGPTRKQLETTFFTTLFIANGKDKDGKPLILRSNVHGPEPGYVSTPICVRECVYTLLLEREKCPSGVFVPASAFAETKLVERLSANGVQFEME